MSEDELSPVRKAPGRPPAHRTSEMTRFLNERMEHYKKKSQNGHRTKERMDFGRKIRDDFLVKFPIAQGWTKEVKKNSIDRYLQRLVNKVQKGATVSTSGGDSFDFSDVAGSVDKEIFNKALFAITRLAGIATDLKATGYRLFVNEKFDEFYEEADQIADELGVAGCARVAIHNNVRSKAWNNLPDKVKEAYRKEASKVNQIQEEQKNADATEEEIRENQLLVDTIIGFVLSSFLGKHVGGLGEGIIHVEYSLKSKLGLLAGSIQVSDLEKKYIKTFGNTKAYKDTGFSKAFIAFCVGELLPGTKLKDGELNVLSHANEEEEEEEVMSKGEVDSEGESESDEEAGEGEGEGEGKGEGEGEGEDDDEDESEGDEKDGEDEEEKEDGKEQGGYDYLKQVEHIAKTAIAAQSAPAKAAEPSLAVIRQRLYAEDIDSMPAQPAPPAPKTYGRPRKRAPTVPAPPARVNAEVDIPSAISAPTSDTGAKDPSAVPDHAAPPAPKPRGRPRKQAAPSNDAGAKDPSAVPDHAPSNDAGAKDPSAVPDHAAPPAPKPRGRPRKQAAPTSDTGAHDPSAVPGAVPTNNL